MIAPATLSDLFKQLYQPRKLPGNNPNSIRQHEIVLRHLDRFLQRPAVVTDLEEDTITHFAAWLVSERKQSPPTVNKSLSKLRAQWAMYNRRGLVSTCPEDLPKLREPKRLPEGYRLETFERLLSHALETRGQVAGIAASRWWYTLLLTMYDTGLRIGATLALRWDAVDLYSGTILAAAETQKQFADQIFMPAPETIALLKEFRFPPREVVFPWPEARSRMYDRFKELLERAGLPSGRRHKFHKLRRTTASHIKAAGGNATEHLGHSSPRVTEGYIDERIAGARCQAHLLPRPFGGAAPQLPKLG
jgi:integrase